MRTSKEKDKIRVVIDSSTLISLAKINAIDLLTKINAKFLCPEEVHEETVEIGIRKGYPDAIIIKRIFDKKLIKAVRVKTPKIYKGISKNDSKIVQLIKQEGGGYLFVDDEKLSRAATNEGIKVRNSIDVIVRIFQKGTIDRQQCIDYIKRLYNLKRISRSNFKKYLALLEGTEYG